MAVVLDTQILIWGGIRQLPDDQTQRPQMADRARWLLAQLDRDSVEIIIPTIVAAELAVPIAIRARGDFMAALAENFIVKPFDLKAAHFAADLQDKAKAIPKKELPKRVVLAADVKIIATAKSAGAFTFYTGDARARRIASLVMEARDLPTHPEELFDSAAS